MLIKSNIYKTCKDCGLVAIATKFPPKRRVCKKCRSKRTKQYRINNLEHCRQQKRESYQRTKKQVKAYQKEYALKNIEAIKARKKKYSAIPKIKARKKKYDKKYRAENREKRLIQGRVYYIKNREERLLQCKIYNSTEKGKAVKRKSTKKCAPKKRIYDFKRQHGVLAKEYMALCDLRIETKKQLEDL